MSSPEPALPLLAWVCLGCATAAVLILLYYVVRRPQLTVGVKLLLAAGLGLLPLGAAGSGNLVGFEATTKRRFCGSCHVMTPYAQDVEDPDSHSLAAMHGRNPTFGDHNCYVCHADYGMYGTVVTKLDGLRHVRHYYLGEYGDMPLEESIGKIHIRRPFPSATCQRCHSGSLPGWRDEPEHAAALEDLAAGRVSCTSAGCHGPAHPFSKPRDQGGTRDVAAAPAAQVAP